MRTVGKFLADMDEEYHRTGRFMGWLFCDLLDYYYGMSERALLEERYGKSGLLGCVPLAAAMMTMKLANKRVKWGPPIANVAGTS
jgi:hypothetical protein